MRKVIVHGAWLVAAAMSAAGCASAAATSASGGPAPSSSASGQPSGAALAASNPSAAPTAAASGPQSTSATGPLGLLPVPAEADAWTTNTNALMGLDAYIEQFYNTASRPGEESQYKQRGFVSGAFEGWFSPDGSQQTIAIARFAEATGATYAFSDLSGSFSQEPAPSTVFTDSADGAVGSADPKLDSEGDAYVDITAHVGDYLVAVQEFSAKTPDLSAAKALLLEQVKALKGGS